MTTTTTVKEETDIFARVKTTFSYIMLLLVQGGGVSQISDQTAVFYIRKDSAV